MRKKLEDQAAKVAVSSAGSRMTNKWFGGSSGSSADADSDEEEGKGRKRSAMKRMTKRKSDEEKDSDRESDGKPSRIKGAFRRRRQSDTDESDEDGDKPRRPTILKKAKGGKKSQAPKKNQKTTKKQPKKKKKATVIDIEGGDEGSDDHASVGDIHSADTDYEQTEDDMYDDDAQPDSEFGSGGSGSTTAGGYSSDGNDDDDERHTSAGDSTSGFTTNTDVGDTTDMGESGDDDATRGLVVDKDKDEDIEAAKDAKVNSTAVQQIQVRVRIVEATELQAQGNDCNPVCRVFLKGKVRTSRPRRATTEPKFNRNVIFVVKASLEQLLAEDIEFKVYNAHRITKDAVLGSRKINVGLAYHQPRHAIFNKWLPLTQDEDDDSEIAGFLRICVSVSPPGVSVPTFPNPSASDNDVLQGFALQHYTLQLRLFSISDLPPHVTKKNKKEQTPTVGIRAVLGKQQLESDAQSVVGDSAHLCQVLQLPIMWPSVIKDVHLQLLCPSLDKAPLLRRLFRRRQRRKNKDNTYGELTGVPSTATAPLTLKEISNSARGAAGFLPTFGPAYLSFYGADRQLYRSRHGKDKKDRRQIGALRYEGCAFYGRLLIEVQCLPTSIRRPLASPLGTPELALVDEYRKRDCFTLFASFFAANMIHTDFFDMALSFELSIGSNAGVNVDDQPGSVARSRTVAVMPTFDYQNYYCMPWGANKPACDLTLTFENFVYRMKERNHLKRMIGTLRDNARVATASFESCPEQACWASILVDTYEEVLLMGRTMSEEDKTRKKLGTVLDHRIRERRVESLKKLLTKFETEPLEGVNYQEAGGEYTQRLFDYADQLESMSDDPQTSIPPVLIRMMVGDTVLGFCKVPIEDILHCPQEHGRGLKVGRLVSEVLKWPTMSTHRRRTPEVPAFVHVRLWFGPYAARGEWLSYLPSAKMSYMAELFENQKANGAAKKPRYSDESGTLFAGAPERIQPPANWKWNEDSWRPQRTFDMYRIGDADKDAIEHVAYEVEFREGNTWKPLMVQGKQLFTDAHGHPVDKLEDTKLPAGWKWSEKKTKVDLRALGDDKGWVYAATNQFPVLAQCDTEERSHHIYRRRKLYRMRVRVQKLTAASDLDLETFKNPDTDATTAAERGWEYSAGFGKPGHLSRAPGDKLRRRRIVREIIVTGDADADFNPYRMPIMGVTRTASDATVMTPDTSDVSDSGGERGDLASLVKKKRSLHPLCQLYPRAYVVYNRQEVSRWQLRAYILWARDLFPASRKGTAHAFCRVSFLNRCKDTYVVRGSINAIWNETLVFDRMLICMNGHSMSNGPPHVLVEVFSHNMEAPPEFIGRFTARPLVWFRGKSDEMSMSSALHGGWQWYPLEFSTDRTRGALLARFQLLKADHYPDLPPPPIAKPKPLENRFEVPPSMRPRFTTLDIQVLCWGVRNLGRYHLQSINHPFVEVVMGEFEKRTTPLQDAKTNPNFPQPIITLKDVVVPERFGLARPVLFNLYDRRSFGREPLVGVCMIKDFRRYVTVRSSDQRGETDVAGWNELERRLTEAHALTVKKLVEVGKIDKAKPTEEEHEMDQDELEETVHNPEIDWWCKYYASIGEPSKAPGYAAGGYEPLIIVDCALEDYSDYNGFNDFVETFEFRKLNKGRFNQPDKTDYRGELKGRLYIYQRPKEDTDDEGKKDDGAKTTEKDKKAVEKKKTPLPELEMTLPPGIAFAGPVDCVVRVYLIRAQNLASRRRSGRCDPYVQMSCGKKNKKSLKKEYVPDTLEPMFGQMVEFSISLPQDKNLTVKVKDRRLLTADEEIGSTQIDLENRLLTKHRATVGLAARYNVGGPNRWRDQQTPLKQLESYCRIHQIDPPKVSEKLDSIRLLERTFTTDILKDDAGNAVKYQGPPVQQIALHILRLINLVPEHVERRPLHNRFLDVDTEQGRLEMFVDLFPRPLGPIPPPLNIALRKPLAFQLRIVIWNLRDVVDKGASSVSGEKYRDLFVKCFVNGQSKAQKTDVHYQCTDGGGSFNFRMLFDLEYDPWERKLVVRRRLRLFRKKIEEMVEPELVIQVWDNNKFKRNHYIGQIRMNLLTIEDPQPLDTDMKNVWEPEPHDKRKSRCPCCRVFCWMCTCGYVNRDRNRRKKGICVRKVVQKEQPPRHYLEGKTKERSVVNEQRTLKGWWPATPTGERKHKTPVTAKVEMELNLLPLTFSQKNPVGKARKEPNNSPYLPKPTRPKGDSWWCTSRLKICWKWTKNQTWLKAIVIAIVVILLLVLLIYCFIGDLPAIVVGTRGVFHWF